MRIGPLLLPWTALLVLASAAVALAVGRRLGRGDVEAVDRILWRSLVAGFVAARLAFVYEYRTLYFDAPLSILDIRDGGWNAVAGLAGPWLYALYRLRADAGVAPAAQRAVRRSLAAATLLFVAGSVALALVPGEGEPMPELRFTTLDGRTVMLPAFAGKPTVVNLWATWCPPCRREMPMLRDAQAARPDVHFVFVNQGESAEQVAAWLARERLALRNVLLDPKRLASATFKQQGYPTTLFFDAGGRRVSVRLGELSRATLDERLGSLERRPRTAPRGRVGDEKVFE